MTGATAGRHLRSDPDSPIVEGLRIQIRVLGAMLMREIYTRFGRENLGYLWMVGEPLLFIGGVVIVRSIFLGKYEHGVPLVVVVATGYPPLVMWRNCIFRTVNCLRFNAGLMFHRQVLPEDIIVSRMMLEVAGVTLAALVCWMVLLKLDVVDLPYDIPQFFLGWLCHMWFSIAAGLLVASLSEITTIIEKTVHVFTYLWLPVGGSFIMANWLPYPMRRLTEYVPSFDAYEYMRGGYFGPGVPVYYDMPYFAAVCAVMTVTGLGLVKLARRRMILE